MIIIIVYKVLLLDTWNHVIAKTQDCGFVISEFELQSRYYVHFRTNTLGEGTIYQPLRSGRIWHKVNF